MVEGFEGSLFGSSTASQVYDFHQLAPEYLCKKPGAEATASTRAEASAGTGAAAHLPATEIEPASKCPVRPGPEKPEFPPSKEVLTDERIKGLAVIAGAGGAAGSAWGWSLDNDIVHGRANRVSESKFWQERSPMLRDRQQAQRLFEEAKELEKQAGKALDKSNKIIASSDHKLNKMLSAAEKDLSSAQKALNERTLIEKQEEYLKSIANNKELKPGANAGTAKEVARGEKLFVKSSELGKSVKEYEKSLGAGMKDASKFWQKDISNYFDLRREQLGSKALLSGADVELYKGRVSFLNDVIKNPQLADTRIGTAADLSMGKNLYIEAGKEAEFLKLHRLTHVENLKLTAAHELALAESIAKGAASEKILARGAGSCLARTLGGGARGLLIAGGMMAVGYAIEHAGELFNNNKQ